MRTNPLARRYPARLISTLAVFGMTLLGNVAVAQTDELTVTAPREVTREQVGRSRTTGAAIEDVSVSEQIAFKDLDLKKSADVDQLNKRIKDAAEDGCSELDRILPFTASRGTHKDCVRKTIRSASAQVDAAVAAAGKSYGNADRR